MPLPKPTSGESKDKFVNRCISEIYPKEYGQREAIAICYNIYEKKTLASKDTLNRVADKINKIESNGTKDI